jgi:transposase
MILMAAQGSANDHIAASLSVPRPIVSKWRKRFFEERLAGLEDEPRTGRPPGFSPRSRRAG